MTVLRPIIVAVALIDHQLLGQIAGLKYITLSDKAFSHPDGWQALNLGLPVYDRITGAAVFGGPSPIKIGSNVKAAPCTTYRLVEHPGG